MGGKNCKSLDWNTFNKDQIKVPEHFSQYSPAFLGEASLVKPLRGHKWTWQVTTRTWVCASPPPSHTDIEVFLHGCDKTPHHQEANELLSIRSRPDYCSIMTPPAAFRWGRRGGRLRQLLKSPVLLMFIQIRDPKISVLQAYIITIVAGKRRM